MTTPTQYEFSDEQNTVIKSLGQSMAEFGIFLLVIGGFYVLITLIQLGNNWGSGVATVAPALAAAAIGAFYMLIGSWTRKAGAAFKLVVTTTGQDVPHLMDALEQLRKLYKTMVTIIKILLVIMIIGFAAALILPRIM